MSSLSFPKYLACPAAISNQVKNSGSVSFDCSQVIVVILWYSDCSRFGSRNRSSSCLLNSS